MPVFGEETIDIDVFSGMTLLTGQLTEKFCILAYNLIKTAPDELIIRDDLVLIQDAAQTSYRTIASSEPIPRNIIKKDFEVFTAVGSPTVNSPSLIAAYDNGSTYNITWLNCNSSTPSSFTQVAVTANRGVKAFCQYRDRYYGSNGTSHIFRISNFSTTPATAYVTTDLAAVGVNFLIAFKNRVFGFTRNRIYWTDLAAIGGYPETWNLSINFSDLPSVDFDITIHNVKVYRGKIYMFTDKGVYSLQANGDPINWITEPVSSNFPIYDRDSVCINKNVVFLTDQMNLYSFDGTTFRTLPNTRSIFYGQNIGAVYFGIVNIYPYEEGILLVRNDYIISGGNYVMVNSVPFYYDMEIWTAITVAGNAAMESISNCIISAGTNLTPYRSKYASSYIYYVKSASSQRCLFVDSNVWAGDILDTNHAGGTRITKYFNLSGPAPRLKERFFLTIKEYFFYGRIYLADTVDITIGGTALVTANMNALLSVFRCRASTTQSRFQAKNQPLITMTGNITPDKSGLAQVPGLVINGVQAIVETTNRAVTELRTS